MGNLVNISSPIAKATAAAPLIAEGDVAGVSLDLAGNLRVAVGAVSASFNATATAAAPSYSEGTPNPLSQNLTGDLRTISKQNGTWTVQPGNTPNTTAWLVQSPGFLFANITTATTTTVKSGAGVLRGVTVNTKGTIASTITIYDNTAGSGTKIGTIDSLNLAGQFLFDVAFATGLTLVTTGTVAPDITVSYR